MRYITLYQPTYEVKETDDKLIVPVVLMVEGVHNGSAGPVLHLSEYYNNNYQDWNDVPVTVSHPVINDQPVSVNNVNWDEWVVGELHDVHVNDGKLKAKAHIDKNRAIAINPEVINYIKENKMLEVSIGAFTENDNKQGTYQTELYESVTTAYQPDHLALLPNSKGACSWSDGCGIRTNEENMDDQQVLQFLNEKFDSEAKDLKEFNINCDCNDHDNPKPTNMEEKEVINYLKENWGIQVNGLSELAQDEQVTKEQALEVLSEDLSDLDKVKELLPQDLAEKVSTGLESYEKNRKELIDTIQDNTEEFSKDKLESFDMETLQGLAKATKPTDYSGNAPVNNSENGIEPLLPAGVEISNN